MDHQEEKDPVWELLGKARKSEPSPFFARNVLREARKSGSRESSLSAFFRHFTAPKFALLASAAAVIAFAFVFLSQNESASPDLSSSTSYDLAEEYAEIEYMGQLMAVTDPGDVSDAMLADFFF